MKRGLWDVEKASKDESIAETIRVLRHYRQRHDHWAIAWSGGKDSTALVTLVVYLIEAGAIERPKSLRILYADTRMELLPLWQCAYEIRQALGDRGYPVENVMAPLDKRMLVYILGRGVPPPNNNTLRWCTRQIKVDPMHTALDQLTQSIDGKVLMLTGVREGESAAWDDRIAVACSRNGSECGQGWFYQDLESESCSTLAPLLHWRVCHIWDWLRVLAPSQRFGGWPTALLADAYGGEAAQEINARTGCVGCPLASRDTALEAILRMPHWEYLRPLLRLRDVYRALREPRNRLRKPGGERRKDGTLSKNQHRMGPITLEARLWALDEIIALQMEINLAAVDLGRPKVDILNIEEMDRIEELIELRQWPDGWTGSEPRADELYEETTLSGERYQMLPIFGQE